jgi:transcriptional regulator with GAF, ATPase, and Fis domain
MVDLPSLGDYRWRREAPVIVLWAAESLDMAKPVGSVNFSAAEREQLLGLAKAGISRVEAARILGRSHSTVVRNVQKLGLDWRRPAAVPTASPAEREPSPYAWTEADDRWLLALAEAGWTQGLAANEMDRPTGTVIRHSKRLGIRWPQGNKSRKGGPVKRPQ